ncbi:MAG TPA: nuclear transport factor 2 family protein [Burkholderiaceae bacterium]|nr:nuclear transport factor 2 family protein [Burkholderiaceae bacterium]
MDRADFARLLDRMMRAAEAGDAEGFAACFTPDAVYHDYVYGPHAGRESIARMLSELFLRDAGPDYRWEMFDPVCDGELGYAWSLSAFTSTVPEFAGRRVTIDGISRFRLRDGLIAEYAESVNGCVAMAQLGVVPERMAKVARKWADRLLAEPRTAAFLGRAKGTRVA